MEIKKPTDLQLKQLLEPTKIYVKSILDLIENVDVKAISHITGGGLIENIPRVLPRDKTAIINTNSWKMPEIFEYLQAAGNIDSEEMFRVLNCGVGMIVVVNAKDCDDTIKNLVKNGEKAWKIGDIISGNGEVSFA